MMFPVDFADRGPAKKAIACHRSQFTPETVQRLLPEMQHLWNGVARFIPGSTAVSGNDLFR